MRMDNPFVFESSRTSLGTCGWIVGYECSGQIDFARRGMRKGGEMTRKTVVACCVYDLVCPQTIRVLQFERFCFMSCLILVF